MIELNCAEYEARIHDAIRDDPPADGPCSSRQVIGKAPAAERGFATPASVWPDRVGGSGSDRGSA